MTPLMVTQTGHGSRVESHSSFGQKSRLNSDQMSDKILETKLKEYNQYYEGKGNTIQYRERNGKFILEGSVRIYWDVSNVIQLKEDNDDRVFIRRRSYYNPNPRRKTSTKSLMIFDDNQSISSTSSPDSSSQQSSQQTSPTTSDGTSSLSSPSSTTEGRTASPDDNQRKYQTLPIRGSESAKELREELRRSSKSFDDEYVQQISDSKAKQQQQQQSLLQTPNANTGDQEVVLRRTCNLRRSRIKLKRRCSINGHFYNREVSCLSVHMVIEFCINVFFLSLSSRPPFILIQ
jgi:hypothetical protein